MIELSRRWMESSFLPADVPRGPVPDPLGMTLFHFMKTFEHLALHSGSAYHEREIQAERQKKMVEDQLELDRLIAQTKSAGERLQKEIEDQKVLLKARDSQLKAKGDQLKAKDAQLEAKDKELAEKEKLIKEKTAEANSAAAKVTDLEKKLQDVTAERDNRISVKESQERGNARWRDGFCDARRFVQKVDPSLKWGEVMKAYKGGAHKFPSAEEAKELSELLAQKAREATDKKAASAQGKTVAAPGSSGTQTAAEGKSPGDVPMENPNVA
ncbi:uncharacterized protein [Spinacia oleracea]|uniref:TolA protein n=1 Tax=Spinacia oleracea TaxID=3562 RepID=A0ABM3RSD0_SPIOL|nr:uncharacterized protein LOC130472102 [Spinacia oleracea]